METATKSNGYAPIKHEYLIPTPVDYQRQTSTVDENAPLKNNRKRGLNKNRPKTKSIDQIQLCNSISDGKSCTFEECKYSHDVSAYLASKEPDIGPICPIYSSFGYCKFGIKCRFANSHSVDGISSNDISNMNDLSSVINAMTSQFTKDVKSKKISTPKSDEFKIWFDKKKQQDNKIIKDLQDAKAKRLLEKETLETTEPLIEQIIAPEITSTKETIDQHNLKLEKFIQDELPSLSIPDKKIIDFRGKTYLAPLTTVGNLPFRRICKSYGVDITCGEMAVTGPLSQGNRAEWALVRRHPCENIFGVQITGSNALQIAQMTEIISNECNVDFIDLNMGCPVDAVTQHGAGSALMDRKSKLVEILTGMNSVSKIPITVKLRTGITSKRVAHQLIPIFKANDVSLVTLHGRSKEQRYTKLADWDYITECAQITSPTQFFGNGDILGWEDYQNALDRGLDGCMVGRGALIKPWIFKEIKERKVYDISSRERLDLLKEFANFGIEHWGSDTMGINHTRRFMCEWLSFLCRYIPVGLLEVLPQKMNERPPFFKGRDELETLMASNNSKDWVKLTEMVLGPAPETFSFIPKHKSNSYEVQI